MRLFTIIISNQGEAVKTPEGNDEGKPLSKSGLFWELRG
jgi:hypothetical protein